MAPAVADALFDGPWIVDGNTAKVKVLHALAALLGQRDERLAILDVGCVGLRPLLFWEPLMGRYNFHLTGLDVAGIDRAEEVVRRRGWERSVTLREGSGYRLVEAFGRDAFDVVVATQVLEHTARLRRLIAQIAAVLCPGGSAFFTVDSAHHRRRYDPRAPVRLLKNLAKRGLALFGRERHYDLPWSAEELRAASLQAGLAVREMRYYNLIPFKVVHNRLLPEDDQNPFMRRWCALEDAMNEDGAAARQRGRFAAIYLQAGKPARGGEARKP